MSTAFDTLRLIGRAALTCVAIDGGMIATLLMALAFIRSPGWLVSWFRRKRG